MKNLAELSWMELEDYLLEIKNTIYNTVEGKLIISEIKREMEKRKKHNK